MSQTKQAIRSSILSNFTNLQSLIAFGEAKNTGVVAVAGMVVGITLDRVTINSASIVPLAIGFVLTLTAMGVSLWSFKPIVTVKHAVERAHVSESQPNLFLFSDIASYTDYERFRSDVIDRYYSDPPLTGVEEDVLRQILALGKIATRKYRMFNTALVLLGFGLVTIVTTGFIQVAKSGLDAAAAIP